MAIAERLGFIADAGPYYSILREILPRAERSIYIVGWDVDSRTALSPDSEPEDGLPQTLLPFLDALLERRPELQIHVLAWDYSFIYAFEREPLPKLQFSRIKNRRFHFALDDVHPIYASHHQKIVVVDDKLAFTGGVDLTIRRWDTPAHHIDDDARRDPSDEPYKPMHDVQAVVSGEAARALADLVRERWRCATGMELRPPPSSGRTWRGRRRPLAKAELWPSGVEADARDLPLGIARTASNPRDRSAHVREIERLRLEAIAAAQRHIFIENQYMTSTAMAEALSRRLREPEGPEVLVVLPEIESGWLERGSMGILRQRVLEKLRAADVHGRLAIYHPTITEGGKTSTIPVHSKVLAIDDRLLEVGSANFSNRSLGLDSEVALVLDTERAPEAAAVVSGLRERLMAEHLGATPEEVRARFAESGSLLRTVEALRGRARTLAPLGDVPLVPVNFAVLDGVVCDPDEPLSPELFIDRAIPIDFRKRARQTLVWYAVLVAVILAAGALIRWGPLTSDTTVDAIRAFARRLSTHPAGPLLALGAFVAGAAAFVPVTVLITTVLLTFGFWKGGLIAYVGSVAAASITYAVGQWVGAPTLQRFLSRRLLRLRRQLARRGFAAVLLARLLPVGNFGVINLLAGAFSVPFRAFVKGNLVGLLPGLLGLGVLTNRVATTLRHPTALNLVLLLAVVAGLVGLIFWIKRALRRPSLRLGIAEGRGQG